MKLIILNYELGQVDIISNVPKYVDEIFIEDILEYNSSSISWMLIEDDALVTRYTYNPVTKHKIYDNENLWYDRR